jgi:transposase
MGDSAPKDLSLARSSPHPSRGRPRKATSLGKKLNTEVEALQQTYPEATVELWCEDEHRIGLKPVLRRVYVPEGEVPIASVNWRFEWLWLYSFVEPQSGQTYWWILPYVNTELFTRVLADFAQAFEVGEQKRILLVIDPAGWHISQKLKIPEGIHLLPLPSHSPELQSAERLWPIVNEPIANRSLESLDELEDVLIHRCQQILRQQALVHGFTQFHWWPHVEPCHK